MFPMKGGQSSANEFLKLKGTAYVELDWLPMAIAKFQGLISMKVLPLSLRIILIAKIMWGLQASSLCFDLAKIC
jgi:hypothetical protein